jgi:hypothetical protein
VAAVSQLSGPQFRPVIDAVSPNAAKQSSSSVASPIQEVVNNSPALSINGSLIITNETQSLERRRMGSLFNQEVAMISLNSSDGESTVQVGTQSISAAVVPMQQDESKAQIVSDLVNVKPSAIKTQNTERRQTSKTLMPGKLAVETSPPKPFELDDEEQRLSATGNRSRW